MVTGTFSMGGRRDEREAEDGNERQKGFCAHNEIIPRVIESLTTLFKYNIRGGALSMKKPG
jgi:hypothetical protein